MAEQRARTYRRNRVSEALREEIGVLIEGELADPRIATAYVSEVALNPGGKSAQVYVVIDGGLEAEERTCEALNQARGFIRFELKERLGVRHVPELVFQVDRSGRYQSRIDELLGRLQKRGKKTSTPAGE